MTDSPITEQVRGLCVATRSVLDDPQLAGEVDALIERLDGPLRVAVAGRVKAGKSTLLNALVGERLAPTDAGECTRVVSWYVYGPAYRVDALCTDGRRVELSFSRDDGALVIDMGSVDASAIERLEIQWPASTLRTMTLIDTPGLASLDDTTSARTRDFLAVDVDRPAQADAVIYLMRHLHRRDAEFLDALADRSQAESSAANAVAVLSRADEVGAGRLDAFESATRIAGRYALDTHVKRLCTGVLPASALIAETAATLEEHEVAALRALTTGAHEDLDALLLSADRFRAPGVSTLDAEVRSSLLRRLGLFGVRYATELLRREPTTTASALAAHLSERSGVPAIADTLRARFLPRAQVLKARSAITGLRSVARRLAAINPTAARELENELEKIEAAALEFTELRLLHIVLGGATQLNGAEVDELTHLASRRDESSVNRDEIVSSTIAALDRWRTRGSAPLVDSPTREACDLAARLCESIVASTRNPIDQSIH